MIPLPTILRSAARRLWPVVALAAVAWIAFGVGTRCYFETMPGGTP